MKNTTVTSIRINKEIWTEAKKSAIECNLKLGEFVESAIIHEIRRVQR